MFLSVTATTDRMALSVSNECLCASQPSESRLDSFPPGPMKSLMENVAVASLAILSSPRHCPDESARRNSRTAEREFLPLQPCERRHAGNKNETAAVQQGVASDGPFTGASSSPNGKMRVTIAEKGA